MVMIGKQQWKKFCIDGEKTQEWFYIYFNSKVPLQFRVVDQK